MSTENEVLMDLDKLTKNYQTIKIYEINSEWERNEIILFENEN